MMGPQLHPVLLWVRSMQVEQLENSHGSLV
jgi:hypothetical protein